MNQTCKSLILWKLFNLNSFYRRFAIFFYPLSKQVSELNYACTNGTVTGSEMMILYVFNEIATNKFSTFAFIIFC